MTNPLSCFGLFYHQAYVHYTAWIEAYTGLMDQKILDGHSLEHCQDIAEKYPSNTLVLLDRDQGGRVAGFACFVPKARDFVSVPEAAEISGGQGPPARHFSRQSGSAEAVSSSAAMEGAARWGRREGGMW